MSAGKMRGELGKLGIGSPFMATRYAANRVRRKSFTV